MYIRWTTYRCPSCNGRTATRLVTAPRVGVEYNKCRSCGAAYRTPDIEWQHMTTGQRVGYFLNEWAVGIIALCVLCAGGVFYADQADWKIPAVIVAVGIGCCVPFWVRKYFAVRSSIRRTTAGQAMQNLGDIQGIDNLAQASTTSSQSTTSGQSTTYVPPAEAPKKTRGMRAWWKIRLAVFAIAVVVGILETQWKTIDKYFPALNKVLHAGTPSSDSDMDYLSEHMRADEQKISEACSEKMEFKECRENLLAAKPALADLHERLAALTEAWTKERSEREVPSTCATKMEGFLQAYSRYLAAEDRVFATMETMDSPEHIKERNPALVEAGDQETAALDALHKSGVGNTCDGY